MEVIEQWVKTVYYFSDQLDLMNYNYTGHDAWAARNLSGPPRVYPRYGDIVGSWATNAESAFEGKQFAQVLFEQEVYVFGIEIYETFHAGAITKVSAGLPDDEWETLWTTKEVEDIKKSRIFTPSLKGTDFKTNRIRIDVDSSKAGTWVQIDAIKLKGTKEYDPNAAKKVKRESKKASKGVKEQWVDKVKKYSSQYDTSSKAADNLRGKPSVYPWYGDIEGAWATCDIDDTQFAVVEFKKKVHVIGLDIYEVFHAGGISRISLLSDKDDKWTTVWTSPKIEDIEESRIFSPPLKETDFKSKTVRLDLDCSVAGTWVEIDAIKLKGKKDDSDSDSDSDSSDSDSDSDDDEKKKKKKKKKKSSACAVL